MTFIRCWWNIKHTKNKQKTHWKQKRTKRTSTSNITHVRIVFNENSNNEGTIEVTYTNIETGEALLKDQQKDFQDLIDYYQGD